MPTQRSEMVYRFPQPVAHAFARRAWLDGPAERMLGDLAVAEALLRTSAALVLADYLSEPPGDGQVEEALAELRSPGLVGWTHALMVTARALRRRPHPPFAPALVDWLVARDGVPTAAAESLTRLASRVAEWTDPETPLSASETPSFAELVALDLDTVLDSAGFLADLAIVSREALPGGELDQTVVWSGRTPRCRLSPSDGPFRPPEGWPHLVVPARAEALCLYPLLCTAAFGEAGRPAALGLMVALSERPRYAFHAAGCYVGRPVTGPAGGSAEAPLSPGQRARFFRVHALPETAAAWREAHVAAPPEETPAPPIEARGLVGQTAAGSVYWAREAAAAPPALLHVVAPALLGCGETTRRQLAEARRLREVSHPLLWQPFGVSPTRDGRRLAFVFAGVEGGPLSERLGEGPLPAAEAAAIAADVLAALTALHRGGLCHGAVHAGNVWLGNDGRARLAVFGDALRPPGRASGGAAAAGPGAADAEADIAAVARLLHRAILGVEPGEAVPLGLHGETPVLPDVLRGLVERGLATAPGDAYGNVSEFLLSLEAARPLIPPDQTREVAQRVLAWLRHADPARFADLMAHWQRTGDDERLCRLHRERADVEGDPAVRLDALAAAAEVAEEGLGNRLLAAALWQEAFALNPSSPETVDNLDRLFTMLAWRERLVGVLETALDTAAAQPERRLYLVRRLATLHGAAGGSIARAMDCWRAVLAEHPDDAEAQAALVALRRRRQGLPSDADNWQNALGAAASDEEWLVLAEQLGTYLSTVALDLTAAEALWREVASRYPEHLGAFEYRANAARLRGDAEEYERMLAQCASLAKDPDSRTRYVLERVRLLSEELDRPQEAVRWLSLLVQEGSREPEVYRRLEALHWRFRRYRELSELLLTRYEMSGLGEDTTALLLRLANLFIEHLRAPDKAAMVLQNAVLDRPADPRACFALWQFAERTGDPRGFIETIEQVAAHMPADMLAEYAYRAAMLAEAAGHEPTVVARLALRAFRANTRHPMALRLARDVLRRQGDWPTLLRTFDAAAETTEVPAELVPLRLEQARVLLDAVNDPQRAADVCELALDVDPENIDALVLMAETCRRAARPADERHILERLAGRHPGGEAARLLALARLHEEAFGDDEAARGLYEQARQLAPADGEATRRLADLLGEAGDVAAEQAVWQSYLGVAPDDAARRLAHERLALLADRASNDPAAAIEHYRALVELVPDNEAARVRLAVLARELGRYDDLRAALGAQLAAARTRDEEADLLAELAFIERDRFQDLAAAARGFEAALEREPNHEDALRALAALRGREGRPREQADLLRRALPLLPVPERVESLRELAALHEGPLGNVAEAETLLRAALALQSRDLATHEALAALLERTGAPPLVLAEALEAAAAACSEPARRAEMLVRAARAELRRGDATGRAAATTAVEHALAAAPGHGEALELALALAIEDERWDAAAPLATTRLAALPADAAPGERVRVLKLAGDVALRLPDFKAAERHFRAVLDLLPDDAEARYGRARALQYLDRRDEAHEAYRALLQGGGAALPPDILAAARRALEALDGALGFGGRSVADLEAVIAERPTDREARHALVNVLETEERWEAAVRARRALIELTNDPLERFAQLMALAERLVDRLEDPGQAVDVLTAATQINPESRAAQFKLLEVQIASNRPDDAARTLEGLALRETDPAQAATYFHTLAELHLERRKDPEAAIAAFERALDADPSRVTALAALDTLLATRGDLPAQEQSCRRMLGRLQKRGDKAVEYPIYLKLGRLYARHMDRPKDAIAAYEEAKARRPDELPPREALAQLYAARPDALDKAVGEYRGIVERDPRRPDPYRALFDLFVKAHRFDAAWCAAGALVWLRAADEKQTVFYERYRSPNLRVHGDPLGMDDWRDRLRHPGEDTTIGEILTLVHTHLVGELQFPRLKDLGLKPKDAFQPEAGTPFGALWAAMPKLLDLKPPPLFRRPGTLGLIKATLDPPALTAGDDIVEGRKGKFLRFHIAKALTYFHPWHVLAGPLPPANMSQLYQSAVRLVAPDLMPGSGDEVGQEIVRQLKRKLPGAEMARLTHLVSRLRQSGRVPRSTDEWTAGVECTANRAGLLLCDDLAVAADTLQLSPSGLSALPPQAQVADLLTFSVTEAYATLRRRLGIHIDRQK